LVSNAALSGWPIEALDQGEGPQASGDGAGDGIRVRFVAGSGLWERLMLRASNRLLPKLLLVGCCAFGVVRGPAAFAADADNGKTLANRWCSSCHVVQHDQKLATDQAPPFASLAKVPAFDANKLAFLLLKPHPNMPTLSLSRAEIADIAEYIATLK
jgi:mono/diheme cytochrome c family protein